MAYIGREPQFGAFEKQSLTADGSTTTFTLDYVVGSSASLVVSVAGVLQEPEVAYNLGSGGSQIVFTAAPASGDTVYLVFLGAALEVATVGSGVITSRTELSAQAAADDLVLIYDTSAGSLKKIQKSNLDTSLDITGKAELAEQAANDDELIIFDKSASTIKKIQKSNIATTMTYTKSTGTGDGSTTTLTISSGRAVDDVLVFVNGVCLVPTDDYSISGTTLTFATAPSSGAEITVRYLPI